MFAVVRVRGKVGTRKDLEDTLKMLRLKSVNHCVLVPETDDYLGMLKKVRDFVSYGIIDFDTLLVMLKRRGKLIGGKNLTEENVKELEFKNIEEMARSIFEGKIKMKEIPKLKPVFRLSPPRKGYKSIRKHYPKGSLGYWGNKINDLIKRML